MKDCINYINKINYLKKMIKINDQNFKMNLNNHTLSLMFHLEKIRCKDELKKLKQSELFIKCISN